MRSRSRLICSDAAMHSGAGAAKSLRSIPRTTAACGRKMLGKRLRTTARGSICSKYRVISALRTAWTVTRSARGNANPSE